MESRPSASLGGVVIAAGAGYTAPALVGSALAAGGIVVFGLGLLVARRTADAPSSELVGARR